MRKKARSHRAKRPLLRFGVISVCVLAASAAALAGRASCIVSARAAATPVLCSEGSGITIPLSDYWQRVEPRQQGLLCYFRNKSEEFPTLNVFEVPNQQPAIRPGVMARESAIRGAYNLFGLTDAQFSDSHIEPIGEHEGFLTTVRYSNRGVNIEGFVLEFQLPDRVFTVTVVDREGHPVVSKEELLATLRGIRVPGEGPVQSPKGRAISLPTALLLISIIGLSLVVFGSKSARPRRK